MNKTIEEINSEEIKYKKVGTVFMREGTNPFEQMNSGK